MDEIFLKADFCAPSNKDLDLKFPIQIKKKTKKVSLESCLQTHFPSLFSSTEETQVNPRERQQHPKTPLA